MSYENISPLVKEIRLLREMEQTYYLAAGPDAKDIRNAAMENILDRTAVLCREFLNMYEHAKQLDDLRAHGTRLDLFGMLRTALAELRK